MRLGDIFPNNNVELKLGDEIYRLSAPNLTVLSRIEQWHEEKTKEKKRWNEILTSTGKFGVEEFAELLKIFIDSANKKTPTKEGLMELVTTANLNDCVKAMGEAMYRSLPEKKTQTAKDDSPAAWEQIIQTCVERGFSYAEVQQMTIREVVALLSPPEAKSELTEKRSTEPATVHPDYDPNWLQKAMAKAKADGLETDFDKIATRLVGV